MRQMSFSCAYRTMRRARRRHGSKIPIPSCSTPPRRTGRLPAGATASRNFPRCRRPDCARQSVSPFPGCHASGFIALVYPLVSAGLLTPDALLSCYSLTGYSGGGKKMIAEYRAPERSFLLNAPRQYALGQTHKHLKEMKAVTGLASEPVFCPVVADFYSGMQVTVPLFASWLAPGAGMEEVKNACLKAHYASSPIVSVLDAAGRGRLRLHPRRTVRSGQHEDHGRATSSGCPAGLFDNLGKGRVRRGSRVYEFGDRREKTLGLEL